jgi:enhancing lycopene biosynthesis protein 2
VCNARAKSGLRFLVTEHDRVKQELQKSLFVHYTLSCTYMHHANDLVVDAVRLTAHKYTVHSATSSMVAETYIVVVSGAFRERKTTSCFASTGVSCRVASCGSWSLSPVVMLGLLGATLVNVLL